MFNNSIKWSLILQSPIKRLNIVENAQVSGSFLNSLKYIGCGNYDIMNILFDNEELQTITWYWKSQNIGYPEKIYVYSSNIEHHLRFGKRKSLHYENWIFGVFQCQDNVYRLSPLKRDSDFSHNIYQELSEKSQLFL